MQFTFIYYKLNLASISSRNDDGFSYTIIGLVSGNPVGCIKSREVPDYFTYIGHVEVL